MPYVGADDVQALWDTLDNSGRYDLNDYSPAEQREIHEAAAGIAEAIANGQDIYDSDYFWDFLDLTGLDAEDFAWEDFREWYDSL
jgi:hypothetical protein